MVVKVILISCPTFDNNKIRSLEGVLDKLTIITGDNCRGDTVFSMFNTVADWRFNGSVAFVSRSHSIVAREHLASVAIANR